MQRMMSCPLFTPSPTEQGPVAVERAAPTVTLFDQSLPRLWFFTTSFFHLWCSLWILS